MNNPSSVVIGIYNAMQSSLVPQSYFIADMGVTMKSLFVIAVAGAIFAICSVEIEGK